MAVEDKMLAMRIRRLLARKAADLSLMEITCAKGVVTLTGEIRAPRGFKGKIDLREELEDIIELIRRMPEVKDVLNTVRSEGVPFRAVRR